MLALLISILIALGIISNEQEYHELDSQTQTEYQETIITEDYDQF